MTAAGRWRWLWRGDLPAGAVRVRFEPTPVDPPPELERRVAENWRARLAAAGDAVLFDGPLAQVTGFRAGPDRLEFDLTSTSYARWVYCLERRDDVAARFGSRHVARPLAMCAALRTAESGLVIQRRSDRVAEGAGLWHVPGGHLDPTTHLSDGVPDPRLGMLREIREELGLDADRLRGGRLLGLIENRENGKPELLYSWRLEADWDEVTGLWRRARDRFESAALELVSSPADARRRNLSQHAAVPTLALLSRLGFL